MAFATPANAQGKPDKILGYYLTYDDETGAEKSQVQIYKDANGKYYGKIVWLKEPLIKMANPKWTIKIRMLNCRNVLSWVSKC